ncbi:hypothetical protein [Piscinibacter defluvii]|uniref:hypothetical protein n=1 Tax=Piscinibacter defluvii TaxID=1796922 RepID=UPI000FDD1765|nr:hypothetical protein [Piscinibacter defluvii]
MPRAWRVEAARALSWALLLGGWIVLTALADRLAGPPLAAFGLIAAWLLALGGFASLLGRLALAPGWQRLLLSVVALLALRGLAGTREGAGAAALLPPLLAWGLLVALASSTVRMLRRAAPVRPGRPVGAAAAGALLAWAVLGDPTDLTTLVPRAGALLLVAALGLAALLQGLRAAPPGGCRAGLFDCSLPAWPAGAWREPARWPLLLGALVMLPMMAGLPQMLALCRGDALGPQAMLGMHLAAMFLPALLLPRLRPAAAALACGALLAGGGLAAGLDAGAWWWLVLSQGAAWSLAWGAQLAEPAARAGPHRDPWCGAVAQAALLLALGLAVEWFGPGVLPAVPFGFAVAAALALACWRRAAVCRAQS